RPGGVQRLLRRGVRLRPGVRGGAQPAGGGDRGGAARQGPRTAPAAPATPEGAHREVRLRRGDAMVTRALALCLALAAAPPPPARSPEPEPAKPASTAPEPDPVLRALRDELSRAQQLRMERMDRPYHVTASVNDSESFQVSASFG